MTVVDGELERSCIEMNQASYDSDVVPQDTLDEDYTFPLLSTLQECSGNVMFMTLLYFHTYNELKCKGNLLLYIS